MNFSCQEFNWLAHEKASRGADKDEYCRCSCHRHGLSSRDCPACYFSDGNAGLNKRLGEHFAQYPED